LNPAKAGNRDVTDDIAPEVAAEIAPVLHQLADACGPAIVPHFRAVAATNKAHGGAYDPVTAADLASETAMRAVLARLRPDDGIVGEEYGVSSGTSGLTWVLDPIDGTRAFVAGTTTWGVLIGVLADGVPVASAIVQPWVNERWVAVDGVTTWTGPTGSHRVQANANANRDDFIAATTDTNLFDTRGSAGFEAIRQRAKITRYGLDCMAYAYLASGGISLVIESGLKSYDVAALIPVVQGAGGIITDWDGAPILPLSSDWDGSVIAAATPDLHALALEALAV
jgi:histidinol phosphatase-like enzyme (inositol monophosphatase family)